MSDHSVYEYERGYLDFTLVYSQQWSVVAKRGTPLLQADVTRVYFYVSTSDTAAAFITLTDAISNQIEWLDATAGRIRVKLGSNTGAQVADDCVYELRIKFSDSSYLTAAKGLLHIKASIVNNP